MPKQYCKDKLDQVKYWLEKGESLCKIEEKTGVPKSRIQQIRVELGLNAQDSKKGRPVKMTPADIRQAVRLLQCLRHDNAADIARTINRHRANRICAQTLQNRFKQLGLHSVVKKKQPLLSARHRKLRLMWAMKYRDYTLADWKRVIWSDKTKINRLGSDGRKYTWKKDGEGLIDREIIGTKKFGGGNLMMFRCMGYYGADIAVHIEGKMTAKYYIEEILEQVVEESAEMLEIPMDKLIWQQDNDPKHNAKITKKWFEDKGIAVMDWPPQSPDLNVIEHLWWALKRILYDFEFPVEGKEELWERVVQSWEKIHQDVCQKLIESLPRRIAAVIRARGGHTKY